MATAATTPEVDWPPVEDSALFLSFCLSGCFFFLRSLSPSFSALFLASFDDRFALRDKPGPFLSAFYFREDQVSDPTPEVGQGGELFIQVELQGAKHASIPDHYFSPVLYLNLHIG